jgi:AcrR family transcriptional regulator
MAHRPRRKSAAGTTGKTGAGAGGTAAPAPPAGSERERIVAAFLTLLADSSFEEIGLGDVAAAAAVSLAQLRDEFASTFAILQAHIKAVDRAVLAEDVSDMAEEPARERLFDVLMRRLEHLAPHRAAIGSLLRSARRNPPLALALNATARRSQQWMLTAAGIGAAGPRGMVRAQATAMMFASVLPVWIDDDDPGQARTMAALDRALGRGQRLAGFLDELVAIPSALCRFGRRRRRRRRDDDVEEAVA